MLRLAVQCAALELVSQTATGTGTSHNSLQPEAIPLKVTIALDFESVNWLETTDVQVHMNVSGITVDSNTSTKMLMKLGDGTAVMYNHMISSTSTNGSPAVVKEQCLASTFAHTGAAADVAKCMQAAVADIKADPTKAKDGLDGYAETENIGPGQGNATVYMDKGFLVHGLISNTSVAIPNQPPMISSLEMDLTPTAGAPPAAVFAIDAGWKCTDAPAPAPPAGPAKVLFDCLSAPKADAASVMLV